MLNRIIFQIYIVVALDPVISLSMSNSKQDHEDKILKKGSGSHIKLM